MIEFVFGTAQLTRAYGAIRRLPEPLDGASAVRLIAEAEQLGFSALDTAPYYGDAEEIIGQSGTTMAVHTKVDPDLDPDESLSLSLARLRRSFVDVLYLEGTREQIGEDNPRIAQAHEHVGESVVALGVSVYEVDQFRSAMTDPRITVVQVPMNALDRRFDASMMAIATEQETKVYARSALLQGVLVADPVDLPISVEGLRPWIEPFQALARSNGCSPLVAALTSVASVEGLTGVLLGADASADLRDLAAALRTPTDRLLLAGLDALEQPPRALVDPRRWV